jgi:predicted membrane metal-binding protein
MIELFTLCLLFGAVLYHSLHLQIISILLISTLTSAFFFIYFLTRKSLVYGAVIGCMILLGAITVWFHTSTIPKDFFLSRTITGTVTSVDGRLDKTIVTIQDDKFTLLLQATISSNTNALPGDTVSLFGAVQQAQDFMTDTGRMFPYQEYLGSKNVAGTITVSSIKILQKGGFSLTRFATIARFAIATLFAKYIAFPIDGLVAGMLVGYQGGLPQSITDLFRTTGVLHVVVLSGENITLLAIFLSLILRVLPFKLRTFVTGFAIVLLVLISGTGVAAVRAGIMGGIALLAGLVRQGYQPLRAITLSILFFFFISPATIFTDPGFALSVLATIFMVIVVPKIEKIFNFLPAKFNIRELGMLAICVPLFMLPYTMYFSGLVPFASPFANILMAIITPFFMLAGTAVLAVSWCNPFVQLVGSTTSFVGSIVLKLLELLNQLPQLNTPPLAWWGVVASYLLFFAIVFRFELRQFIFDQQMQLRSAVPPLPNSSEPESQ